MVHEVKSGGGLCCGVVAGFGLLLFAVALVATSQLPALSADARKLQTVAAPQLGLTKMTAGAAVGALQIQVSSSNGFQKGMYAIVDAMSSQPQTYRIFDIQTVPSLQFVLEVPLVKAVKAGAVVYAKPADSLVQESMHRSSSYGRSSGPSASLDSSLGSVGQSSDSSIGSSSGSFGSFTSSSGSSGGGANSTSTGGLAGAAGGAGGQFLAFILSMIFACVYKSKVIDNPQPGIGVLRRQYDTRPEFKQGLFECIKDPHICCMTVCCPWVRIAHTNEAADVCGYWETFVVMWCATLCVCGPLCLNVYFRMHVKEALGIQDNCCVDVLQAFFCLSCVTGQQALAVDEGMGYKFTCPFTMTSFAEAELAKYDGMIANAEGMMANRERQCSRNCFS